MVSLQGKLWVPKKQLVPTQRALVEHIALTQAEPGCQAFEVRQSTDDPLCFDVNERFDDDEAFMIHQQRVADSPWGALTKGFPRHYKVTGQFKGADVSHMQRALVLADAAAAAGEVPVGAVLVQNGVVIGEGANGPIDHHDPTAHAEILALRQGALLQNNYRLPDSVLYVTIEPCLMCVGALIHARVGRVVFGAREPKAGALGSFGIFNHQPTNHRFDVVEGVLEQECGDRMRVFFSQRREAIK
jgi:tRNA(adenine34) deaminase